MGRNIKEGLSYFPLDVDFFEDEKMQFISASFGVEGEAIILRLLCKIYRKGYALHFDKDVALLFARSAGNIKLVDLVEEVVNEAIKRSFFDESLFEKYSLLSSRGIQKRYTKICQDAKRKDWKVPPEFDLLSNKTTLTPEESTLTPEESTERKEENIKGNESIKNQNSFCAEAPPEKSESINNTPKNFEKGKRKKNAGAENYELPSSSEEVKEYFKITVGDPEYGAEYWTMEKCNDQGDHFFDHYTANGWKQGQGARPIVNWKAAVRNWVRNDKKGAFSPSLRVMNYQANRKSKSSGAERLADELFDDITGRRKTNEDYATGL